MYKIMMGADCPHTAFFRGIVRLPYFLYYTEKRLPTVNNLKKMYANQTYLTKQI